MADAEDTAATSETDTAPEPPQHEQLPDDHPLVKTLAAQRQELKTARQTAQSNADKAKRLDDIEEANKSEIQKLQDQLTAAQNAANQSAIETMRAKAASAAGVPVELLTGSTPEEVQASADALKAFKGDTPKAPPADVQGNKGEAPIVDNQLTEDDVRRLYAGKKYAEIETARASGRLVNILGA